MVSQAVHLLPEGGPEGEAALQGNQGLVFGALFEPDSMLEDVWRRQVHAAR
eukprot:CAMPEP_0180512356 /NCGR_PEP_ID=MMETSP1036_2-20121128/51539_1 /TAXON_ID=632150 /ORGANISM="Azadinium spinosum, Strain 3D9" /LENGTH=50 /DNA_ID=CAMNT_0022523479 /DNA_START=60 /DNA_END=209 /DNA_ORIENTATION=+